MADTNYPLAALRFQVDWGGAHASFTEVTGLDAEMDAVEYRGGADSKLTTPGIPGLMKYTNVTMKRGVIAKDNDFFDWWNKSQQGHHEPRDLTVLLLNEMGVEVMMWTLRGAWPVKVEGPSLSAKSHDVAIEAIEFCHQGVEVKPG